MIPKNVPIKIVNSNYKLKPKEFYRNKKEKTNVKKYDLYKTFKNPATQKKKSMPKHFKYSKTKGSLKKS